MLQCSPTYNLYNLAAVASKRIAMATKGMLQCSAFTLTETLRRLPPARGTKTSNQIQLPLDLSEWHCIKTSLRIWLSVATCSCIYKCSGICPWGSRSSNCPSSSPPVLPEWISWSKLGLQTQFTKTCACWGGCCWSCRILDVHDLPLKYDWATLSWNNNSFAVTVCAPTL